MQNLLAAVKTEWSRCGEILARVQKRLQEASNTIDQAHARTRVIGKKLSDVEALPVAEGDGLLAVASDAGTEDPG